MSARWIWTLATCVFWLPTGAPAGDWPQFRGSGGTGVSAEKQLPNAWSKDKNVLWTAKIPGYGWSSPIVWGDKVFVTTAVSDKQTKPGGFGGMGGFGGPRGGGRGGFGGPPPAGQILPSFLQDSLELSEQQTKQVKQLQKGVDDQLAKVLTEKQQKQLKEPPRGFGFGRGGRRGGGFGGPPKPGQILPPATADRLELTDKQKKQLDALQKVVDAKLAKILTDKQNKQLKDMAQGFRRGGFGGGMRGGRGGPGGFGGGRAPNTVYKWELYCLNAADGKVLWKKTAAERKPPLGVTSFNTYATETPVTDGRFVYAYFGMTGVFCYDMSGKLIWNKALGAYRTAMGHGTASSPVLAEGRLFIQCDNEEKSFLVALDAKSGDELWRVKRTERTAWSTPLVWKNKKRTEVVCVGSRWVRSYDPANGKLLWELGGLSEQPKASAVASADFLYVGTGGMGFGGFGGREGGGGRGGRFGSSGKPLFAVKAGASGDITLKDGTRSNDGIAWQLPQAGPSTASPLLYDGLLYILEDNGGILSCYNAKTGKKIYKERLPGARGFTSSPWAYDGKIFALDQDGQTFVVQAGPQFKVLHKNSLGETFWASPAVARGTLWLRGVDHLYCIR